MIRNYTRLLFRMTPLLLVGALSACASFGRQPAPVTQDLALPAIQTQVIERTTYVVERGVLAERIDFSGEVGLSVQEDLFFSTPGRVRTVYVQNGDSVKEGDLIAELDTRDLNFELQQAQFEYERAKQRLEDGTDAVDFAKQDAAIDLAIAELRLEAYQNRDDPDPQELAIRERQVEQAELSSLDLRSSCVERLI